MSEAATIGLDIAKYAFHAYGADERGAQVFSRSKLLDFFMATLAASSRWKHVAGLIIGPANCGRWGTRFG